MGPRKVNQGVNAPPDGHPVGCPPRFQHGSGVTPNVRAAPLQPHAGDAALGLWARLTFWVFHAVVPPHFGRG
jgi:hypothetical protein